MIDRAVSEHGIRPGMLTLGTDNGSAFTARATRLVLSGLGVAHRRGGHRDPESQAFIESGERSSHRYEAALTAARSAPIGANATAQSTSRSTRAGVVELMHG